MPTAIKKYGPTRRFTETRRSTTIIVAFIDAHRTDDRWASMGRADLQHLIPPPPITTQSHHPHPRLRDTELPTLFTSNTTTPSTPRNYQSPSYHHTSRIIPTSRTTHTHPSNRFTTILSCSFLHPTSQPQLHLISTNSCASPTSPTAPRVSHLLRLLLHLLLLPSFKIPPLGDWGSRGPGFKSRQPDQIPAARP